MGTNQPHLIAMRTRIHSLFLLVFLAIAGCGDTIVAPVPQTAVRSLNVTFTPAAASLNGMVASEQFRVPGVTPWVVDQGAVLVYFRDQSTWTALPFTVGRNSGDLAAVDYTFTLGYAYDEGFVEIFMEASTDDEVVWRDIVDSLPRSYAMKIVILDVFPAGKTFDLDLRNYEAVRAYFGLEE